MPSPSPTARCGPHQVRATRFAGFRTSTHSEEAIVNNQTARLRRTAPVALAVLAMAAVTPVAYAAPQPFESYRANCPGYGDTRLTEPGNGAFMPFFIEDTHQLLVPYVAHYSITGGGTTTNGEFNKPAALPDDAITCTFTFRFHVDGVL